MPNQSVEGITILQSIQNHTKMPVNLTSEPWVVTRRCLEFREDTYIVGSFDGGLSVPFSTAFESYRIVEGARRIRQSPIAAYGSAVLVVGLAALLRWVIEGQVVQGVP